MRVEGGKPSKGSLGGWIHKLSDPVPIQAPKPVKKIKDVSALAMKMFGGEKLLLACQKRESLAKQLGVSVESLVSLQVGIGWDHDGAEYASFPSRDAVGKVIGITRRYGDGKKKTLYGTSNAGIFAATNWWTGADPVCIVEGATDVAALETHGFAALGRPSNVGGAKIIAAYLTRRAKGRAVVVLGENDFKAARHGTVSHCPPTCKWCAWCWPGRFGAEAVNSQLCRLGFESSVLMPPRGIKDAREWLRVDKSLGGGKP
jgi:hypothetical protein